MLIFLKDTSQRGSDIRRFGSATAAFISDYNDTYKQVHIWRGGRLISDPLWLVSFRNISLQNNVCTLFSSLHKRIVGHGSTSLAASWGHWWS